MPAFQLENIFDIINRYGKSMPVEMDGTTATGSGVLTNGQLGADLICVKAGESFPLHTHSGDHLLIVIKGRGSVTVGGVEHRTVPGDTYMVNGQVEHAVAASATEDHYLLSIGAPHKQLDAPDRMTVVE